ncbi:MAG TPA: acyclic terpene utilization AtuA family protein [Micromonosporaceae bacterium]
MTVTPLRIGNASGFYGDRFAAFRDLLTDGPIDVLTGDYLAELTMLILGRDRLKDPGLGYARTYLKQMEDTLGLALDKGVTIVTNAGGLNPAGCAAALRELAERLGLHVAVAHVEGDDLLPRAADLGLGKPLTANAYLGAFGIAECLRSGADVVVTGRVTDASLVLGPAVAHFGWGPDDHDTLAGAVVAGHVIECGTQATGGNYSFFTEHDVRRPGFPIAEIHPDGSSVITKHDGTGGAVTVGTVTAQLLYEIDSPRYAGPDVTARFDTIQLDQDGPDRVRVTGIRGEPPPPTLKVGMNTLGGFRNEITFVLTGLDIDAKAELVRDQMEPVLARHRPREVTWTLVRTDRLDAQVEEEAAALLRLAVKDPDPAVVGRAVSRAGIELALASYPGFHVTALPSDGSPYGVFTTAYLDAAVADHTAVLPDGTRFPVPPPGRTQPLADVDPTPLPEALSAGPTRRAPLGLVAGARSGDKGGACNVGVWVRDDTAWRWLVHFLTVGEFTRLLPETARYPVTRYVLPNLRALNFVVDGLLGEGVAAQARFDPQGKAVGEWLRARHVDIPEALLADGGSP